MVPINRMPEALWAALRHNVLPGEYFAYDLWRPERKANIDNYLYAKEGPRLFKLLNRPSEPNPIDDKLAFFELCKAQSIPTPEILAVVSRTAKVTEFGSALFPTSDLFVKPRCGRGGEGSERLRWQESGFESNRGCRLLPQELRAYLQTRAHLEARDLLVQPALSNHPKLQAPAPANLATARLVTGISDDGKVIPIIGFIYFPEDDQIPPKHLLVALIDLNSGHLTSTPQKFSDQGNCTTEDGSAAVRRLPDWEFALRKITAAHQACCNFVFLGWDVAFTMHGPMILEGNANWCADEYQRLRGEPLGHTKFVDILERRLRGLDSPSCSCVPKQKL
jgi:hypothetical protein